MVTKLLKWLTCVSIVGQVWNNVSVSVWINDCFGNTSLDICCGEGHPSADCTKKASCIDIVDMVHILLAVLGHVP